MKDINNELKEICRKGRKQDKKERREEGRE